MISKEKWLELEKKAKQSFKNFKPSHDWGHVERVWELCLRIVKNEKADLEVLKAAVLFHDIAREEEDKMFGKGECHAKKGAELAGKILRQMNFPKEKIPKVLHCIRTHRFSGNDIPKSIEAKILFDADKLDVLGAIGIARTYCYSGEYGQKLYSTVPKNYIYKRNHDQRGLSPTILHFVKLQKIKDRMLTATGKKIAKERCEFTKKFFDRLGKEIKGEL